MKTKISRYNLMLLVFLCSKCLVANTNTNSNSTAKAEKLKEKLSSGEISLSSFAFSQNKGQVHGYDGLPHSEVMFSLQQGGTQIFVLEKGIAYQFTKTHYPKGYQELLHSVCPKTRCLDGKIQFRGVLKKMIVRFTGVNERLFFLTQRRKWSFRPNTK